jgi:hypothetical protein
MVDTADEGVAAIESGVSQDRPFDLVITHWGHNAAQTPGGLQCPTAVGFLSAIRSRDLRCPVIVFAREIGAPQRKLTALGLGALAYCFDFSSLYRTIEDALSPGE